MRTHSAEKRHGKNTAHWTTGDKPSLVTTSGLYTSSVPFPPATRRGISIVHRKLPENYPLEAEFARVQQNNSRAPARAAHCSPALVFSVVEDSHWFRTTMRTVINWRRKIIAKKKNVNIVMWFAFFDFVKKTANELTRILGCGYTIHDSWFVCNSWIVWRENSYSSHSSFVIQIHSIGQRIFMNCYESRIRA